MNANIGHGQMQRMESDRSLNTELALKDVYNKKRLYSAIGFEKEKEREVLNTVS